MNTNQELLEDMEAFINANKTRLDAFVRFRQERKASKALREHPLVFTAKEVARELGIGPEAVNARARKLGIGRRAGFHRRFTRSEIERLRNYGK